MSEVERARELLERERGDVLAALARAGEDARELARQQEGWRSSVSELLERGRTAGVPVTEMAAALGLSRQWTSHLLARQRKRVLGQVHAAYHLVQSGAGRARQARKPTTES